MLKRLHAWLEGLVLGKIHKLAHGRRYFLIEGFDGSPYLLRLLLRGRLPGEKTNHKWSAYLHRFYSNDRDREVHNHPWNWSFSIVLWGGYTEIKRKRNGKYVKRRVFPGRLNWLGPKDFHRVLELHGKETWTLFLTGGKGWAWGFIHNWLFMRSKSFLKMRGHDVTNVADDGGPLPPWLLTCACCEGRFPPPGKYHVRGEPNKHLCQGCATLPLPTFEPKEVFHVG